MENKEMTVFESTTLAAEQQAQELDNQIKLYANAAWINLVEACKCLKRMRDTKLYEKLGYSTFGEYTEASLNIKERQAYTYISTMEAHGEAFLQLNANLGITKLALISNIPAPDRQDFVESHDLAGMTVEQVKELVAANDQKGEQIGMLQEEIADKDDELTEAEERIRELEAELEVAQNKPTEVAVREPSAEELLRIREAERIKAKKEYEKTAKSEKAELKKKLEAERDAAVNEANAKAIKEIEDYKNKVAIAEGQVAAAVKQAEELQKQLSVSSSPEATKFTFFFEALAADYDKLLASLETLKKENPDVAAKYGAAMKKYHGIIKTKFADIGFPLED
ncbi:MAG: DUF3102 domain-containing protein [Clostridia bacterium]|nr:DUF3102 domain-containing protein [Clostridia bacterium]MBR6509421.1 DUF3102 domain-containing protein [Clostridia bacterium]